jgi:hypothetical protein
MLPAQIAGYDAAFVLECKQSLQQLACACHAVKHLLTHKDLGDNVTTMKLGASASALLGTF